MTDSEQSRQQSRRSKVARLLAEYELADVGDRLEDYWLAETGEQKSLRDLAEYFNQRLVEAAMERRGMDVLEGEAANYHRLLTGDDVSSGVRVEARNTLESNGIDVEQLERDFVSRQAIHTYLTKARDLSYPEAQESKTDRIERRMETIQRLKNRLAAVSDGALHSLRDSDDIAIGEPELIVNVRVRCTDCQRQYDISELLSRGGCACEQPSA